MIVLGQKPVLAMRAFPLDDILSVTIGRFVSRRHVDGLCDILAYMIGKHLYVHQIPRATRACQPALILLYPYLSPGALQDDIAMLDGMLRHVEKGQEPSVCTAWTGALMARYGNELLVPCLASLQGHFDDPLTDMQAMMQPGQEIIAITPPQGDTDALTP